MNATGHRAALDVLQSIGMQETVRRARAGRKVSIYTTRVVIWLMIAQHLLAASMADIVADAKRGAFGNLIPKSRRRRMSVNTGAYAKARARMSRSDMEAMSTTLYDELDRRLVGRRPELNRPVKLLDGSSVQLESSADLKRRFPPAENQHGRSHWPVLKMDAIFDAQTALVWRAAWGPMYGARAVSEQGLAKGLIEQLPPETVLLGDCNFGIFIIAWQATQRGCDVVLRLTKHRAAAMSGEELKPGLDRAMIWRPSRSERSKYGELPAEAQVAGRLLVFQPDGGCQPLYLFTSLSEPASKVVEIYGLRWNVETDLRSLKRTVQFHHIDAKSADMMEKEILTVIAAYNLTRTVMCLAAEQSGIQPRELSFARVMYLVHATLAALMRSYRPNTLRRELDELIHDAATCKLPKRKKRRTYPRAVWRQRLDFPPKHEPTIGK